jgi:hypothetical protein
MDQQVHNDRMSNGGKLTRLPDQKAEGRTIENKRQHSEEATAGSDASRCLFRAFRRWSFGVMESGVQKVHNLSTEKGFKLE